MNLALAFLAGMLTTLSPCVLPLLPILLGGALQQHPLAPVALAGGLSLSFTVVGLLVATLGFASGIDGGMVRVFAAVLMAVFGLILVSPRLQTAFAGVLAPVTGGANGLVGRVSGNGIGGQFVLGLLLGAAWSPCAGPTLGAALGMAAGSGSTTQAGIIMILFSIGAATPMLVLAYGSRKALSARRDRLSGLAKAAKPAMGAVLLAMGLLIVSGLDKMAETYLIATMPSWLVDLTTRF